MNRLKGIKIGVVLTGSHCTIADVIPHIKRMKDEGAKIFPSFHIRLRTQTTVFIWWMI